MMFPSTLADRHMITPKSLLMGPPVRPLNNNMPCGGNHPRAAAGSLHFMHCLGYLPIQLRWSTYVLYMVCT